MVFLSTYRNRIDKKGRVSVPAPFRSILAKQDFQGIVAYASLVNGCVEGCGINRITKLQAQLEQLDPFSEEYDAFATTIFGESVQLGFDSEGRVTLPAGLIDAAGIKEEAVFVGKGEIFEIWEPEAFDAHAKSARALAIAKRLKLKAQPGGGV